jgi:hypothetical protein
MADITIIPENTNPKGMWIYLEGTGGTVGNTYIAIDDITVVNGACVQPANMFNCSATEWIVKLKVCDYIRDCSNGADELNCTPTTVSSIVTTTPQVIQPGKDLACNFDAGNFCIWMNNNTNRWIINNPNVALLPRMPSADHSLQNSRGRYMYVTHDSQTLGPNPNLAVVSALDNAVLNYVGPTCIQLWYYMRIDGMGNFNVTMTCPTSAQYVVSRTNDHGEKWNQLTVDAHEYNYGCTIGIEAMVQDG